MRYKCDLSHLMIYTLTRDDIPNLSAWIKKFQVRRLGSLWRRHPDLNRGIRVLQTRALPLGYVAIKNWSGRRGSNSLPPPWQGGALPDELRPLIWCLGPESNQRHADFQSAALPTELPSHLMQARICGDRKSTRLNSSHAT